jgi:hypothetical protein
MLLALPLVLASQLTAVSPVPAETTGTLTGRVLPPADGRAVAKTLWIGGVSTPVDAGGRFRAVTLPSGPSHVFVETSEGLYAVSSPVILAPGTTTVLQLALSAPEDTSAAAPAVPEKEKKPAGFWANPTTATLVIIGSAIVVGFAVDQLVKSDDEASPFVPASQVQP